MNIDKIQDGDTLTMKLWGKLDTTSAPKLEEELNLITDDASNLIFDFKELNYLSSAGLRVILAAHKKMVKNGGLKIKNVNDTIMDVFTITGFSDILTIMRGDDVTC